MCVALVLYFFLLGRIALAFITSGEPAAIGLGLAVMMMPLIGIWVMVSTLRAGFTHQRLGESSSEGMELDVGSLRGWRPGGSSATPPTRSSRPCAKNWRTIRATGDAGIGWLVPTITPVIAAVRGKP